ncbi:MAG TPA: DUF6529 family protein [Acidimicrobiales bacterium]|nr:DUF6529 family protein [Acidimicrobiales bacterium]
MSSIPDPPALATPGWSPAPGAPPPPPPPTPPPTAPPSATGALVAAAVAGGAVALALGTYGRVHEPTGDSIATFGFPAVLPMKAWFGTVAFALVLAQLASALAMWGRLPGVARAPGWLAPVHRWSGTAAFVVSLPVAYHCLWSLGFQDTDTRVLAHSLAGCAFYGAFATKLLALRIDRLPGWALPVAGGLLVTCLTAVWLTSSLWFFTNVGFPGV